MPTFVPLAQPRSATFVVAASDTIKPQHADYRCDGTADNVQIQAAITACNAAGGGTVLLRSGTYDIAANITLSSNVALIGENRKTTIIDLNQFDLDLGGNNVLKELQFLAGTVEGDGVNNIDITGCEFDGTGNAATSDNLYLHGDGYEVKISDCTFRDATRDNCRISVMNRVHITNCFFFDASNDNLHTERGSSNQVSAQSTRWQTYVISGCTSVGAGRYGIFDVATHDLRITNCVVENSTVTGIYINTPIQATISNCILERNSSNLTNEAEIVLQLGTLTSEGVPTRNNCSVVGNNINAADKKRGLLLIGSAAGEYDILVASNQFLSTSSVASSSLLSNDGAWYDAYNLSVFGNTFTIDTTTPRAVVLFHSSVDTVAENIYVRGNVFMGGAIGVIINRLSDVLIESNTFRDLAVGVNVSATASTEAKILRNRFRGMTTAAAQTANSATYVAIDNDGLADNP